MFSRDCLNRRIRVTYQCPRGLGHADVSVGFAVPEAARAPQCRVCGETMRAVAVDVGRDAGRERERERAQAVAKKY